MLQFSHIVIGSKEGSGVIIQLEGDLSRNTIRKTKNNVANNIQMNHVNIHIMKDVLADEKQLTHCESRHTKRKRLRA